MDPKHLEDRLRSLSGSQQSIESLSEYCVKNVEEAEGVVRLWRQECERSPPDKRLVLLYLANDILQNCRKQSPKYSEQFVGVLPRVVRHLFKGGPDKVRKSLGRLVGIWEERKVLDPRALKAMRDYFKRDVKGGARGEREESSRKRARPPEPLVKLAREAEAAGLKTSDWQAKHLKLVEQGIQSENMQLLEIVGRQLVFYGSILTTEIQARRTYADHLRSTLKEQEQAEQRSREIFRLCKMQQAKVRESMDSLSRMKESEAYSPSPPEIGSPAGPSPEPLTSVPELPSQNHQNHILQSGAGIGQSSLITAQSGPAFPAQQYHVPQPQVPDGLNHGQEPQLSYSPPPPILPSNKEETTIGSPHWKAHYVAPANPQGLDVSTITQPPQTSAWQMPPYPVSHNDDVDPHSNVANHQSTVGTMHANTLDSMAQDNQEEYGVSAASSLKQSNFGFNAGGLS